jgi:hypothetical protein
VTPQFEPPTAPADAGPDDYPTLDLPMDEEGGSLERLDQVAAGRYGDPALARPLAEFNGLDDLLDIPAGTVLGMPPVEALWKLQA